MAPQPTVPTCSVSRAGRLRAFFVLIGLVALCLLAFRSPALAEEALVALAEGRAEAPPKPAVHTAPGMFANAMPAIVAALPIFSRATGSF